MDYKHAYDMAITAKNKQAGKPIANNTRIIDNNDFISIKLHDTDVIRFYSGGGIVLNSGGWRTKTTKERINTYTNARISQKNNLWYMSDGTLFYDGVIVDDTGKVISKKIEPKKKENETKKIKLAIKKYVDGFVNELSKGMDAPSGGDCWFCSRVLSDTSTSHITDHMEENYFVPSLVLNAVTEQGYPYPAIIIGYDDKTKKIGGSYMVTWAVKNSLRKYLSKRLVK